jgi:hypothetical protein
MSPPYSYFTWFAVDRDGHVAAFYANEFSAVAKGADVSEADGHRRLFAELRRFVPESVLQANLRGLPEDTPMVTGQPEKTHVAGVEPSPPPISLPTDPRLLLACLGYFQYESDDDGDGPPSGSYSRLTASPSVPVTIDLLTRSRADAIELEALCFAETPTLKPADHVETVRGDE